MRPVILVVHLHRSLLSPFPTRRYMQAKQLLQLFGVPYIVAPMEAEAQCAQLELCGAAGPPVQNVPMASPPEAPPPRAATPRPPLHCPHLHRP